MAPAELELNVLSRYYSTKKIISRCGKNYPWQGVTLTWVSNNKTLVLRVLLFW